MTIHAIRALAAAVIDIYSPVVQGRNVTLRYLSAFLLVGVLLSSCGADEVSTPGFTEADLRQAQASRIRAMINADAESLDTLLADELSYSHSTGQIDSKSEFIGSLLSGVVRYRSIEPKEINVRIYDDIGIITSVAAVNVTAGEQDHSALLRTTEVYQQAEHGWLLIAYQSTRVPQ